jgi:hypothetical protein
VPSGRSSPPHDTFFIGGDDMGIGAAEHELRWDSFAYPSTFSNGTCCSSDTISSI